MQKLILTLTLVGPFLALALAAEGADRSVVVPKDNKPFTVEETDIVRLSGKGIAGSSIKVKVQGPAKVENSNSVTERINGATLLGNHIKEFEIKPTGKGKVKVTISVAGPQPGLPPRESEYEFQVK